MGAADLRRLTGIQIHGKKRSVGEIDGILPDQLITDYRVSHGYGVLYQYSIVVSGTPPVVVYVVYVVSTIYPTWFADTESAVKTKSPVLLIVRIAATWVSCIEIGPSDSDAEILAFDVSAV